MIAVAKSRQLTGGFTRRGACPALSAPMATGDGLLVRLNPVAGGLSPAQLAGLCKAAETYGNGVIEVTARGSIQLRGLTEASAPLLAQAVGRLGISVRTGVPVQTGVLAGLDPEETADSTELAESIRAGITKAGLETRLGPKVSVVVDGGGRTGLDEVAADVRLTAVGAGSFSPTWQVAIAGDAKMARALGVTDGDEVACEATLALLSGIAAMGRETRARDLDGERLPAVPSSSGLSRGSADVGGSGRTEAMAASILFVTDRLVADPRDKPEDDGVEESSLTGITSLRSGRFALGVALPFGHTSANLLITFVKTARTLGIEDIRPAPRRTLVAICGTAVQAELLRKKAETLGFITSPDDPRQAISACPGAPGCASGHIPARQIAAEIASEYKSLFDGSMHLHVSGCAKGCAHPGKAELTIVGGEAGTGLVAGGTARDEPLVYVASGKAKLGLAGVAALVGAERRKGETTAQAIQRLGLSTLAETFRQGAK
jgi:precorrin-3B synthase